VRRTALLACAVALLGAVTACAGAKAGDSDLVDDWPMMAAATVPEPQVGECRTTTAASAYSDGAFDGPWLVDCAKTHEIETVAVGQITGAAAQSAERPERKALAPLFPQCEKAAAEYLGGDWQSGRVQLYLQPPSAAQWRGGARFFHCDVLALKSEYGEVTAYGKPFKDVLKPGGPLALGCGNGTGGNGGKDDVFKDIAAVACTEPHDVEFAGYVTAPPSAPWPTDDKANGKLFDDACEAKMLQFLGMSHGTYDRQPRLWWISWDTSAELGWAAGDHSARCYVYVRDKKINHTLKKIGNVIV
jgi:hypothetical protein